MMVVAMSKCPRCRVRLKRVMYEGLAVHQCPQCNGFLLPGWKLEGIKKNPSKSVGELREEAEREFKGDSTERLKCPQCFLLMRKQVIPIPVLEIHVDACERCGLAWLDGGELAILQLAYEASEKCHDAREFQRRMLTLLSSPERRQRLEAAIARATGPPWLAESILDRVLEGLLMAILRRGVPGRYE